MSQKPVTSPILSTTLHPSEVVTASHPLHHWDNTSLPSTDNKPKKHGITHTLSNKCMVRFLALCSVKVLYKQYHSHSSPISATLTVLRIPGRQQVISTYLITKRHIHVIVGIMQSLWNTFRRCHDDVENKECEMIHCKQKRAALR